MRRYAHNLLLLATFVIPIVTTLQAQTDTAGAVWQEAIRAVRADYAPDRRSKQLVVEPVLQAGRWVLKGYTTEADAIPALLRRAQAAGISALDSVERLPSAALGDQQWGLANVSVTNNRYEPRQAAEMATQMTMGMPLQILKRQNGYLLVRCPDGYIAWTEDLMVHALNRDALRAWNQSPRLVFTAPVGYIREAPGEDAPIVSDIVAGGIVRQTGTHKKYYRVQLPDGRNGYIPRSSAQPWQEWLASRTPTAEAVERVARTMMGTPYLWGGTSVKGVDCSGFVKTSWFLQGMILPRDASQQAGVGEVVPVMDQDTLHLARALQLLRRGDLLFFSSLKDGKPTGRITHVAVYIADGQFIHASGLVRINSMKPTDPGYADWNTRAFAGARRLAGVSGDKGFVRVADHPWYNE